MTIEPLELPRDREAAADIIRRSFRTVADDLGLTEDNAPTNPAFFRDAQLDTMAQKGISMLILTDDDGPAGFAALERAGEELYYLEKLAVLPEKRHRGLGRKLVEYCFRLVARKGGGRISIGIINENRVLKDWYGTLGFRETGLKDFPRLPFTVCFMEKRILPDRPAEL
jgi:ribosomal protein S18 acetylase RimI-like enzyme